MATPNFFEQLEDFLPSHVSPVPSYIHAFLALIVAGVVSYYLGEKLIVSDFTRDGSVSETEERAKKYIRVGTSAIVTLFVADTVFSVSFKLGGFRMNKKHFTYRRWFPSLYS